jgi:formyl-CoA transferase
MDDLLFKGLKVLDVGSWIAGPVAGTILADFGAEVIKIEIPEAGDFYRQLSALPGYPDAPANYMWEMDARNKRSLTLNLKTEKGMEILHQMVKTCDVYITNQPFPMRESLNLMYEDLKPLNPAMIYASLSAYGEKGPDRNKEGFDLVAYWARTGLMELVRDPEAIPSQAIPGMGDHPSAVTLYAAIVTALLKREKTGEGSMVHTSLMANGVWSASSIAQAGFSEGNYDTFRALRRHRRHQSAVYQTADARFLQFTMVRTPEEFARFLTCIDLHELVTDDRFESPEKRFINSEELSEIIQRRIIEKPADAWLHLFVENDVHAVLVARIEELVNDVQVYENNMVTVPTGDGVDSPNIINHPINIDGLARVGPRHAPGIGEHRHEILSDLGYDDDTIRQLIDTGVI